MTHAILPHLNTAIGYMPLPVLHTICQYTQDPFRKFVDLTNKDTLKELLAYKTKADLTRAMEIAKRTYEAVRKEMDDNRGYIFPADAEVLVYAMEMIKAQKGEKQVLEMGCASGENGLFLLNAGPDKVIFNDIESQRLLPLKKQIKKLPKSLQDRCEVIEGDCFNLLQEKRLCGRIHLILCRNLLHFIQKKDREKFFSLINHLLAPGGKAIFTANSLYDIADGSKEVFERFRGHTYFNEAHAYFYNSLTKQTTHLFQGAVPVDEPLMKRSTEEIDLYQYSLGCNISCTSNWKKINPIFKDRIKEITTKINKQVETRKIPNVVGGIAYLSIHGRCYDFESITDLFEKHSLTVETTFLVNDKGHLVHDFSKQPKKGQIGVIVQKKRAVHTRNGDKLGIW